MPAFFLRSPHVKKKSISFIILPWKIAIAIILRSKRSSGFCNSRISWRKKDDLSLSCGSSACVEVTSVVVWLVKAEIQTLCYGMEVPWVVVACAHLHLHFSLRLMILKQPSSQESEQPSALHVVVHSRGRRWDFCELTVATKAWIVILRKIDRNRVVILLICPFQLAVKSLTEDTED